MILSFKNIIRLLTKNLELIFWVSGLIYLLLISQVDNYHYSFCLLKNLGFKWCPGCNLGKSISMIFQLKVYESITIHPFGIFALIIITLRIKQLLFNKFRREHYG